MAPIRDWTGAITISPLPYCEIAAGWRWGICCGKGATALTFKDKNDCPLCGVQSYPFLNERTVDNGKILYVIWWWNGKKFVTLRYRFGVAPIRKRAMKRESGENPEQTELLYASTFNPIACSLPC